MWSLNAKKCLIASCLSGVLLLGCASPSNSNTLWYEAARTNEAPIKLDAVSRSLIGKKIWQNEAGGTIEGLTHWNQREGFASLGIGHFIWFPDNKQFVFQESFPQLIRFLIKNKIDVPTWLVDSPSPWPDYETFMASKNSAQMNQLRQLLADTIELQLDFIVQRSQQALTKMVKVTSAMEQDRLISNYYAVAQSPRGMYALIDYVNFKGEGIKASEKYRGQGWGLRDVLLDMHSSAPGIEAAVAFSEAAKRTLTLRAKNGPAKEATWLNNWLRRCGSYARSLN